MSFLDKMASLLSYIPSFFTSSLSPVQKNTHVYERYPSNAKITDCFNAQMNQLISQRLVPYQLRSARLSLNENGRIAFAYNYQGKQIYLCDNQEQLFQWLQHTWPKVNIWEVEDVRTEKPAKLLLKIESGNIHQFQSDQELFNNLREESGDLWKLNCVDWDAHSARPLIQTVYIRAKKNWSNQIVFEKRDIDDLIYNVPEEILQTLFQNRQIPNGDYNPQRHTLKGLAISLLLMTAGLTRFTQTASQVRGLAFSTFFGYGLAQTVPSTVNLYAIQPNITLNIPHSQVSILTLRDYFQDFTPPNGNTLNFFTNTPPSFLQPRIQLNIPERIIEVGNISGTVLKGNTLISAGSNITRIDINSWNVLDSFTHAPFYYRAPEIGLYSSEGGTLNVIHLAAGSDGCHSIPLDRPLLVNVIPAITNVSHTLAKENSSLFSFVDGNVIFTYNMAAALNSSFVNSFDSGNAIVDFKYCNHDQWVCYLNPTGLGAININLTPPISLGYIPLSSPGALDCRDDLCYVGESSGVNIYNITALNPTPIATTIPYTTPNYSSITYGGLIYTINGGMVDILVPTSSSQIALHSNFNFYTGIQNHQVTVNGNTIYVATDQGIVTGTINEYTLTGSPQREDRGTYAFTMGADNYNGESVLVNVTLHVLNQPVTVLNPLSFRSATVGEPYTAYLSNTFSDSDDDLSTLFFTVDGLPSSFSFDNNTYTIQGTPQSSDEGIYNITATATDPLGSSASTSSSLQINSKPVDNGLNGGQIAGILVGIIVFLGGAGGLMGFLLHRKKKKKPVTEDAPFKLLDITVKTKTLFGGHYATLEWDEARIQHCLQETGFQVKNDLGEIDNGANGKVCICWNISENKYVAVKYVEDPTKIQQCEDEAEIQKEAAGEGVWTVHNYSIIEGKLIIITELAELGDGDKFLDILSKSTLDQEQKQWFITYFIYRVLKGLDTLSKKEINHGDLKLTNILVKKNGEIGISDFGSAQIAKDLIKNSEGKSVFKSKESDMLFKSNEECLNGTIIPEKGDAYAAGWLAYEALSNQLLETLLAERQNIHVHELLVKIGKGIESPETIVQAKNTLIESLDELDHPAEGSLWDVISKLLRPDPNLRWNASKALNAACFKKFRNLSHKHITSKFEPLFNEWLKEKNAHSSPSNFTQRLNHYGTVQESNQIEMKERIVSSPRLDHYGVVPQPESSQILLSSNLNPVNGSRGSSSVYIIPSTTRKNSNT
ncbi:MAG: protein kinase [Chlamydiales bacterium]|nr:protein kinase [Chlamydiales bacterium]